MMWRPVRMHIFKATASFINSFVCDFYGPFLKCILITRKIIDCDQLKIIGIQIASFLGSQQKIYSLNLLLRALVLRTH